MAPFGLKLRENAFQVIPEISFFDAERKKNQPKNSSENFLLQPPPPAVPKLSTAVYPSNLAPIGLKLCQSAFQTIPDISFFDENVVEIFANFEGPFTPRGWLRLA